MSEFIDPSILKSAFVERALLQLGLYSQQASMLLMGTAAVESDFRSTIQAGGPAIGYFQMEPATFDFLLDRFLASHKHAELRKRVLKTARSRDPSALDLRHDHLFAVAMARVKYFTISKPIPNTVQDQSFYWWTYYNGRSPHGLNPKDYMARWKQYNLHKLFSFGEVTDIEVARVGDLPLPAKAPDMTLWSI